MHFLKGNAHYNERFPIFGNGKRLWLEGIMEESVVYLAGSIPETVFCIYMLTAAVLSAGLLVLPLADVMKWNRMCIFIIIWHFVVFCPMIHSNWHQNGFLYVAGIKDYAGGNVIFITAGISGLVANSMLRKGGDDAKDTSDNVFPALGASMLWVGWLALIGGRSYISGDVSGNSMLMTQIAVGSATIMWCLLEVIVDAVEQPTLNGILTGAIAGLVAITPGAGYVNQTGAFFTGFICSFLLFFALKIKSYFKFDDSSDKFIIYGVGGFLGGMATAFFASMFYIGGTYYDYTGDALQDAQVKFNGMENFYYGVFYSNTHDGGHCFAIQLFGVVITAVWSAFFTFWIVFIMNKTIGLTNAAYQPAEVKEVKDVEIVNSA